MNYELLKPSKNNLKGKIINRMHVAGATDLPLQNSLDVRCKVGHF